MLQFLSILFVSAMIVIACNKNEDDSQPEVTLTASKTTITRQEQVSFTLENMPQGALAKWTATPTGEPNIPFIIDSAYSYATNKIRFLNPGTYEVKVEIKNSPCAPAIPGTDPKFDSCFRAGVKPQIKTATIIVQNL